MDLTGPATPIVAFGHAAYPNLYAEQAIGLANGTDGAALPNAPYTPTIKSLSLDYTATHTIDFSNYDSDSAAKIFYVKPFGNHKYRSGDTPFLLPQYTDEGTLLIGLRDFAPPQTLSLLFQLV